MGNRSFSTGLNIFKQKQSITSTRHSSITMSTDYDYQKIKTVGDTQKGLLIGPQEVSAPHLPKG